jgi:hypothetical protein
MKSILQSLCHKNATKTHCKGARQTADNLQSHIFLNPARSVQIAHRPTDLSQSAWFFIGDRLSDRKKFLFQIFSLRQAAAMLLEVFQLDIFSTLKRIRHRYVYCWLILVRN